MDVKDAIAAAKSYVREIYEAAEPIADISLEEVEFDGGQDRWLITLEFSRPMKDGLRMRARELLEGLASEPVPRRRVQKVVVVSDKDGTGVAMKNREAA